MNQGVCRTEILLILLTHPRAIIVAERSNFEFPQGH